MTVKLGYCLLQSNCLGQPHSAGDGSATRHSSAGTKLLEPPSAGRLRLFQCSILSQNDVLSGAFSLAGRGKSRVDSGRVNKEVEEPQGCFYLPITH
ncbi:hypothetical protein AVEN_45326-1 [Araneus ventricosus]|uniref:Uncharacterized protein n=1 Tax=Araneus ventricosus TaxID=182803 RepID=A0A4Y2IC99_ARAVE|nr:hypothetical protein AVEN_45326-1 [Araneus ventricosus]